MNRDNLLFTLLGLMVGFITAYFMFEAMQSRQPARLLPGSAAAQLAGGGDPSAGGGMAGPAETAGQPPGAGPAAGPGAGPAAAPMMAQIQQLKDRVQKNPDDAEAVLQLANANFDIQRWDNARDLYTHFLELRPGEPDVVTDLGITYRALGQYERALGYFADAQKLAPDHWQSRFNEVIVLAFDLKQFDKAQTVLTELQRLQPGNADVARLAEAVERQRKAA